MVKGEFYTRVRKNERNVKGALKVFGRIDKTRDIGYYSTYLTGGSKIWYAIDLKAGLALARATTLTDAQSKAKETTEKLIAYRDTDKYKELCEEFSADVKKTKTGGQAI